MDVTPSDKMFDAMRKFTDAVVGEEPSLLDISPGAQARRVRRTHCMDFLHGLVHAAMREGVNRKVIEIQRSRAGPRDAKDLAAADQAVDDAQAGRILVPLEH